jgi:ribosome biogenesis GTPase A
MKDAGFEQVIQWYPGHMVAAMRRMSDYVKLVDVVIEVADARVPESGFNPMLDEAAGNKRRLKILSRDDLAERSETVRWLEALGPQTISVNARTQGAFVEVKRRLRALVGDGHRPQRAMVVGVPNSGKSSIINGLAGRSVARTEDRAGVTRQLQWFKVGKELEVMDTPGILVPRIASADAQWKLALVGAVPRDHYDPEDVADRFHRWLTEKTGGRTKVPDLPAFAHARGFVRHGGESDYHNAARSYVKDFNDGKFGRITLESATRDVQTA